MNSLINDLLLISRVGRLHNESELVDLNNVISDIRDDMEVFLTEKKGEIIYSELPIMETQSVWIRQLFSNLINNGIKYNKSPDPKVWVEYEDKDDKFIFSIKDNGIGIAEEHHDKIFKIFQRLHAYNEYSGTGAGLTISKKIVESMGGTISLESEVGKGTTFYVTLPKNKDEFQERISTPPIYSAEEMTQALNRDLSN
jgi:light-regulated signal transduction histidine kinase (bacteriophytochrome)